MGVALCCCPRRDRRRDRRRGVEILGTHDADVDRHPGTLFSAGWNLHRIDDRNCGVRAAKLDQHEETVDLLLETSAQVAIDTQGPSVGETEMPPTRDLVEHVYEQVTLIILREVLGSMFGSFGKPVYWLYHVTLIQTVRAATSFLPSDSAPQKIYRNLSKHFRISLRSEAGSYPATLDTSQA